MNNTKSTRISLFLICFLACMACKTEKKSKPEQPEVQNISSEEVPRSDQDFVKNLFDQVDQIDYIYHNFDFSMSISEPNAVKSNIATLSGQSIGAIPIHCKPIGRQMFMAKGEMLAEADLYFSDGCQFLVFVEKEKPVSGSRFNETGITFYNSVFAQVKGVRQ